MIARLIDGPRAGSDLRIDDSSEEVRIPVFSGRHEWRDGRLAPVFEAVVYTRYKAVSDGIFLFRKKEDI